MEGVPGLESRQHCCNNRRGHRRERGWGAGTAAAVVGTVLVTVLVTVVGTVDSGASV